MEYIFIELKEVFSFHLDFILFSISKVRVLENLELFQLKNMD